MKEREISLSAFIFELLLRWRTIVLAMLVGMILLGGFSVVSSYRTYKAQMAKVEYAKEQLEKEMNGEHEEAENIEVEQKIQEQSIRVSKKWLEENLTDIQKYNVNYVLICEDLYRKKAAYIEESVLMHIDPNNVKRGELTFLISSSDLERTYNLVKYYEDLLCSGEMYEVIAQEVKLSTVSIAETVTLEKESYGLQEGADTVRVRIIQLQEQMCDRIAQSIIGYVNEKASLIEDKMGEHELTVLSQSVVTISDTSIMNYQKGTLGELASLESSIAGYKGNFSEKEWQYYDVLLNGKVTALSVSKFMEESATDNDSASVVIDEGSLTEIINEGITVYPSVSVRYVILGAMLAAFMYVVVFFSIYLLNARIRVNDNMQMIYGIPQLGVISNSEKSDCFLGFVDDWIVSVRDWNKRKFAKEKSIALAAVAVRMSVEKNTLQKVYLVGCDLKNNTLAVCEQLKTSLCQEGLDVDILNNILYDAKAMSELHDAQGVVLVEKAGSTLYTEIEKELELLKRQDIKVLGGIIVE